jgi:hypothetical protein
MNKAYLALAAVLLLVVAVVAYAQMAPPNPPPGGPGIGRQLPVVPPVMVAQGDFLYILRGNQLTKVKASDLEVVAQKQLPVPRPPQAPNPGE